MHEGSILPRPGDLLKVKTGAVVWVLEDDDQYAPAARLQHEQHYLCLGLPQVLVRDFSGYEAQEEYIKILDIKGSEIYWISLETVRRFVDVIEHEK